MPKKTYFNLPIEKQKRIFDAGVLEFSYNALHDASVNTIVKIADISKGSFYQYFEDKTDFYWFIVMEIIFGNIESYEISLRKCEGDFLKAEENLFLNLIDLFDDTMYRNLLTHVYRGYYFEFVEKLSDKGNTIYFKMYDVLMKFGFKGYDIRSKEDFLIIFDMIRNVSSYTIMTMIRDDLSKQETKNRYFKQIEYLRNGIKRKGLFK